MNKQEIKKRVNLLFEKGINKNNVVELIEDILKENNERRYLIEDKVYVITNNAFESDLLVARRQSTGTYSFGAEFLKEVKNDR